mgnify:CR=1 FL=1
MKKSIIYLAISATLTFSGCDYLYLELLTINRSKVTNEQLLQRLQEWATNSNLKKVTTSLNKL